MKTAWWRRILSILTITISAQVIRALFPILTYQPALRLGHATNADATRIMLLIFAAPVFVPLISHIFGLKKANAFTVSLLAVLRVLIQISPSIPLIVLAAITALIALPLGILWIYAVEEQGGRRFAEAIIVGLALDCALNSAFLTWDYLWRQDANSFVLSLVISGLLLFAIWRQHMDAYVQSKHPRLAALLVIGAFLFLQLFFLQNPAFVASFTNFSVPVAGGLILFGDALALLIYQRYSRPFRLAAGAAVIITLSQLQNVTGLAAAFVILVGQILSCGFLIAIFSQVIEKRPSIWKLCAAAGIGSFLFLVLVGVYYAPNSYNVPYPREMAAVIAGGFLALICIFAPIENTDYNWHMAFIPLVLLIVPLGLWIIQPTTPARSIQPFRIMTYNIHQGVNLNGWVNLEDLAVAIETQNPDVVLLQEVSRGMLSNGSVDTVAWLSWRLNMNYRFAPAADKQLGNAILSHLPILDWDWGLLPRGGAPQNRSYVRARLDTGAGEPMTIIGTHLNHFGADILAMQIGRLLELWGKAPRTIIAGDMNTSDTAIFQDAGLVSAQDVTENSDLMTFDSENPSVRIDWIFGSPDLQFSDFNIPDTTASDHLPVVVTADLKR